MRILSVHNRYQIAGGEDESQQAEVRLLREAGHEVIELVEDNRRVDELSRLRAALRTTWSRQTSATVRALIQERRPDIVHVQNFFPLVSPSVHHAAHGMGVPVVQTLRNYRLFCPNALFFRDGHVCEDCLGKPLPLPGVIHACYRGSRPASAAVAAMITTHRVLRTWTRKVDVLVALTEFSRRKFIEGGLPAERLVVKPNFVHPDPGLGPHDGDFALYAGRLTIEKGVRTLLDAWRLARPPGRLVLAGDGPLRGEVERAEAELESVEYRGPRPIAEVYGLMARARLVIVPSEWYETFGRVAVEAFATGAPVVAGDIGAVAEVVEDGRTGLLFAPGNASALAGTLRRILADPARLREMGTTARETFEARYSAERNYELLLEIYRVAAVRAGSRAGA